MDLAEARVVARSILDQHGLNTWTIQWSQRYWRAGHTYRLRRTINLSELYAVANPRWRFEQIVLHEVAHALTIGWHNESWREVARRIGCLWVGASVPGLVLPPLPWTVMCGGDGGECAGWKAGRARRPRAGVRCSRCSRPLVSEKRAWSGGRSI